MKCNYCGKIFDSEDSILAHFHHLGENHYDVLTVEDKIMYETRKKMINPRKNMNHKKKLMVILI